LFIVNLDPNPRSSYAGVGWEGHAEVAGVANGKWGVQE